MFPPGLLIDSRTGIVFTVSNFRPALFFLLESMADVAHVAAANLPNYRGSFFLSSTPSVDYPRWTWEGKGRTLAKTQEENLTPEVLRRSRLAVEKGRVIQRIMSNLTLARAELVTGIELQQTTYLFKHMQAQFFKDMGYDESRALEVPFVLQYADYAGISLAQAADDILLKSKMYEQTLLNTELLRLKYFNMVKETKEPEELQPILDSFMRDCFRKVIS